MKFFLRGVDFSPRVATDAFGHVASLKSGGFRAVTFEVRQLSDSARKLKEDFAADLTVPPAASARDVARPPVVGYEAEESDITEI